MKAFAWATPDFDRITREHFLSTIPLSGLELHMRTVDDMGHVGDFDTPSMLALAMRRDREILQLLDTEKEPFLVTDCDVRFYGRVVEDLLKQLGQDDISFQNDLPSGYPCMGFFVVRPCEATRSFMRAVIAECERTGRNDQESAKAVLDGAPIVSWTLLPSRYWSYGASTGKRWAPGDDVDPPAGMFMHHGNWTVGIVNKQQLLDAVKAKVESRVSARTRPALPKLGDVAAPTLYGIEEEDAQPTLPTVDFFLVTYPKDYDWLPYLFRSIDKFATGFRKLVMVLEEQDQPPANLPAYVEVKQCRNYRGTDVEGYWGQSIEGLRAHLYSDADVIWFLESDCVFTRPIDVRQDKDWPASKPVIVKRSWDKAGEAVRWRESTKMALLGHVPPGETMCCHPFVYPKRHIADTWQMIWNPNLSPYATEDRLRHIIKSGAGLSQFNVLGNAALVNSPDRFHVIGADALALSGCMRQFWSHARPTDPRVQEKLRELGLADAAPAAPAIFLPSLASPPKKREPPSLANPPLGVVIQFWAGDQDKALRLARFLADLEPERRDDAAIILCRRFDVPMSDAITSTLEHCKAKFPVAQIRSERELEGHPNGCYGLWAGAAEQCYRHYTQDWPYDSVLFVEADGVPCRRDWIDWLKAKHNETLDFGKRITGPRMERGRSYCQHINGTLVMHMSCWGDRKSLHTCRRNVPWDIFHAQVLMDEAGPAQPIFNVYGAPKMTAETFAGLSREYAWLANVKDESAWECAQAMLPGRSRKRWRLVYVAAETKAVLAASEQLCEAEADVVMPAKIDDVPMEIREGVSSGRVKVAIQEVEVAG